MTDFKKIEILIYYTVRITGNLVRMSSTYV